VINLQTRLVNARTKKGLGLSLSRAPRVENMGGELSTPHDDKNTDARGQKVQQPVDNFIKHH
jgi:hypothetical protein